MNLIKNLRKRYHQRLQRKKTSLYWANAELTHRQIGTLGEQLACSHLIIEGYKILYNNFRPEEGGEIDIVARDSDILCFIEVKTRTSTAFGRPLSAVSHDQQCRIERGARSWLKLLKINPLPTYRFDVVEVILTHNEPVSIKLIKNAF